MYHGGAWRSRTALDGFAIRCITALLTRRGMLFDLQKKEAWLPFFAAAGLVTNCEFGAGNEARTRDLNLGKVALYQLSYSRVKR